MKVVPGGVARHILRLEKIMPLNTTLNRCALIALAGAALSSTAPAQPYERAIGDPDEQRSDWVISVQGAADGFGSAHAGWSGVDTLSTEMYVARLDNPGATIWDTRIGTPNSTDVANRIELSQTPDDGYLVAGGSTLFTAPGANPFGISLTRLDVNGSMIWARLFQGDPFGTFGGTGLDVYAGGRSLLCGRIQLQQFADQGAVVHNVDAAGNLIWGKYYADFLVGPTSYNSFQDVHVITEPDGTPSIVAVGYTAPNSFSSLDTLVVKLDMTGAVLWANTYGPDNHSDAAMGLEPAANGDLLVTGYTKEAGEGGGTYIMRLDPLGNMLWWKDYRFIDATGSIHEEANGDIVVAGTANDFNTGVQDLALMQTDAGGNLNWVFRYGGQGREYAEACDISQDGYVMTAWSESYSTAPFDLYALAADPAGKTGCELDWDVVVTPRQHPFAGHFYLGYDIPDQVTPPFEQDFPHLPNVPVCNPNPCPTCSADWAAPLGVSDFSDIIAFLNALSVCDPCAAQLAPPLNVCDFSDVVAFLSGFGVPCP